MADHFKMPHEIKFATRQRLQFIEVMAYYTGSISRSQLARAFGISDAAATKDLKLYNELAPDNIEYNPGIFSFIPGPAFAAVFADLSPQRILPMFAHNLLSMDNPSGDTPVYGISVEELPFPARLPDKSVLAQIIRAIRHGTQLNIEYHSLSDHEDRDNRRIIEPHALINTGLRWHVRAYDQQNYDFRDFVLSRITRAEKLERAAESSQSYDDDWMEQVSLRLQAHPGLSKKQQAALNHDYNMQNGTMELRVRRALTGYILQQMKVDTTQDHRLNPNAYQLILANRDEIELFAGWAFL